MQKKKLIKIMEFIEESTCDSKYTYYCGYGTLIGTIREKGLIPWDEDCDIWVPITYYDEFIDRLKQKNNGSFSVLSRADEDYSHLFSRVVVKGDNHLKTSVDIFPLVGISENKVMQKKFIIKSKFIFKFYFAKCVSLKEYKYRKLRGIQILLAKIVVSPLRKSWFLKRYDKQCEKYPLEKSEYIYNICGSYGKKEIFKHEWFKGVIRTDFEYLKVNSPSGYDELLTHIYGDYKTAKREDYLSK